MESFKASVPEQENSTPFMAVLSKMISRGFSAETKFESIKKRQTAKLYTQALFRPSPRSLQSTMEVADSDKYTNALYCF